MSEPTELPTAEMLRRIEALEATALARDGAVPADLPRPDRLRSEHEPLAGPEWQPVKGWSVHACITDGPPDVMIHTPDAIGTDVRTESAEDATRLALALLAAVAAWNRGDHAGG